MRVQPLPPCHTHPHPSHHTRTPPSHPIQPHHPPPHPTPCHPSPSPSTQTRHLHTHPPRTPSVLPHLPTAFTPAFTRSIHTLHSPHPTLSSSSVAVFVPVPACSPRLPCCPPSPVSAVRCAPPLCFTPRFTPPYPPTAGRGGRRRRHNLGGRGRERQNHGFKHGEGRASRCLRRWAASRRAAPRREFRCLRPALVKHHQLGAHVHITMTRVAHRNVSLRLVVSLVHIIR